MAQKLLVMVSLDVEEEGLFSGHYPRQNLKVTNVAQLRKLAPLSLDLDLPLTLFCTWPVFSNDEACGHLDWMRAHCRVEIGAHLHHWHTPPQVETGDGPPERSAGMESALLESRLATLLASGAAYLGKPLTSFRMGRWDLPAKLLPMFARAGILVDSSVCPLRVTANGPDHFSAPADPYWVELPNGRILEAPITQIPLFRRLPGLWKTISGPLGLNIDLYHFFGALSVNPYWHSQRIMRLATMLHAARGGKVINLFWHSSEMLTGASPHIPTKEARNAMLAKIFAYFSWLHKNYEIQGVTATQLAEGYWQKSFPVHALEEERDW